MFTTAHIYSEVLNLQVSELLIITWITDNTRVFFIECRSVNTGNSTESCHCIAHAGWHSPPEAIDLGAIGKPRVSPLLFLNTSAVIRYLICVYASHFFAGRPYHFNQTLCTANKFYNGDNRWVCLEKYWSLMKVRNQPTLRRMKIYYYWTNIRKWNYFNISFIEDFRK